MNLIQSLDQVDQKIFLFLNGLHCPFMDNIMWQISGRSLWIPLYLIIIYFLIRERKRDIWVTLIAVAIMILLSDQLADLVKNTVQRLRPTHNPVISGLVHIIRNYRGGDYGFVSNHTANAFAVAAFVSKFFARRWITIAMLSWATLVSYSRIYLGVHYPFDVLGGAILGFLVGIMMFYIERFIQEKYIKGSKQSAVSS
jgi:undecaprenyl-diphosphatase